jgi:hypothetical protein
MKKLIFLFVCSTLAFQFVFAQQDFREGYIVTTQRDTISLKIEYRSKVRNYASCHTQDGSGSKKEYGPGELLGYGFVNDKYFESGIVEGSFVEVLVRGELSLYLHATSYYVKKDAKLYQLEEKDVRTANGSTTGVSKAGKWKGVLAFLISDCMASQEVLKNLRLAERPLTELVIQYNTCRKSPFIVYKAAKPWTKTEAGFVFGMSQSTLLVDNSLNIPALYGIPYMKDRYQSLDPSIGLILSISSPRVSEKLAFQPEVHVSKVNYSSALVAEKPAFTLYNDVTINITTISIPLLLKYSFPGRKYFLHLNAGANLDAHIKSDTKLVRKMDDDGVVTTEEGDAFKIKKNQLGYLAGAGVMRAFPKFKAGLLLRYAMLAGFSASEEMPVKNRKLSLSLVLQMK